MVNKPDFSYAHNTDPFTLYGAWETWGQIDFPSVQLGALNRQKILNIQNGMKTFINVGADNIPNNIKNQKKKLYLGRGMN